VSILTIEDANIAPSDSATRNGEQQFASCPINIVRAPQGTVAAVRRCWGHDVRARGRAARDRRTVARLVATAREEEATTIAAAVW
jgi:hypothetical protein